MGLGIILFTGRQMEELPKELVDIVDLIIDGDFEENNIDMERNLVGSKNQRLIFITDRYKELTDWFFVLRPKRGEINISDTLFLSGDKLQRVIQSVLFE
jgi:anaerobic ribonucleoside-triphosphate reductase activating protein